ncbi:MAG: hypothetical protein AB7G21_15135 [Dehalococcoidia bacterium]
MQRDSADLDAAPRHLADRAEDNLRFIRSAMEGSSRFTDVSGVGMVLIGVSAVPAAIIAAAQPSPAAAMLVWQAELIVAVTIGLVATLSKASGHRERLLAAPARKFALGLAPPLAAGGVLTLVLQRDGLFELLPGMWLVVYGAAIAAAGAFSVRILPALGMAFMTVGTAAFLLDAGWAHWLLGLAFGGLHIACGLLIARRYGG